MRSMASFSTASRFLPLPVQEDIDACMKVKLPYSAAPDALGDFKGDTSRPSATLTSFLPADQPTPAGKPTDPGTWWTKKAQSGLGLGLGLGTRWWTKKARGDIHPLPQPHPNPHVKDYYNSPRNYWRACLEGIDPSDMFARALEKIGNLYHLWR